MEEENRNAYSEVIEILKLIDDEKKLEALPIEMLEVLKVKSNPEYKPQISMEIPLEEQNLQDETYRILSWIATKYWNEEVEEVDDIQENIQENIQDNVQENIQENIQDNVQESIQENIQDNIQEENIQKIEEENGVNLPVVYKDLRWYEKIKIKIIEIFNKLFRKNKNLSNEEKGLAQ